MKAQSGPAMNLSCRQTRNEPIQMDEKISHCSSSRIEPTNLRVRRVGISRYRHLPVLTASHHIGSRSPCSQPSGLVHWHSSMGWTDTVIPNLVVGVHTVFGRGCSTATPPTCAQRSDGVLRNGGESGCYCHINPKSPHRYLSLPHAALSLCPRMKTKDLGLASVL